MFIFSEFDPFSKAEISKLIKRETKMLEAKFHSEIEMMKAKCLSENDVIKLIKSNAGSCKMESEEITLGESMGCPVDKPVFRTLDGTLLRYL